MLFDQNINFSLHKILLLIKFKKFQDMETSSFRNICALNTQQLILPTLLILILQTNFYIINY